MTFIRVLILSFFLIASSLLFGQEIHSYKSKIADLGDIQMQYMDFGGEGMTFIWVQDFHNYFEGEYFSFLEPLLPFLEKISQETHVLAPIRRGYGKSTDTSWGYDVATQASDLIHWMDQLNIEKAVFFGRIAAAQDMTWIAENYPERVLGLIYDGNPILIASCYDPELLKFAETWTSLGLDFDKEKQKKIILSRLPWKPEFLSKTNESLDIPTLRFLDPKNNWPNPNKGVIESGFIHQYLEQDIPGREEEFTYLRELVADSTRMDQLYTTILACDQSEAINQGMERTFGKNLQTVNITEVDILIDGRPKYFEYQLGYILPFLRGLK